MFDPILFISIAGYGLAATLLTGLLAPFNKKLAMRADAHWIPLALMAASAVMKGIQQHKANKQIKGQAAVNDAWRRDMLKKNQDFLAKFGGQLAGPQVRTTTSRGGTSGRSSTQQRQIVDPAQAAMKTQLEGILSDRLGKTDFVTPEERAATMGEIARTERGQETDITNFLAKRNIAPGSNVSMLLPASNAASANRLNALAGFAATNRAEAAGARGESANFMDRWKGQDTNQQYSSENWNDTTNTDPTGGLAQLYGMTMYDPGAEQKPMTVNPLLTGGQELAGSLASYYANRENSGGGGGTNQFGTAPPGQCPPGAPGVYPSCY